MRNASTATSASSRYDPTVHLLSRIGLLALGAGMDDEAERIFRYQRRVLADPSALEVSRAIVLLRSGRALDAVRILREDVLAQDPAHGAANAILGVALQSAGLPGSRECFETVLTVSFDTESRALATAALAEA